MPGRRTMRLTDEEVELIKKFRSERRAGDCDKTMNVAPRCKYKYGKASWTQCAARAKTEGYCGTHFNMLKRKAEKGTAVNGE